MIFKLEDYEKSVPVRYLVLAQVTGLLESTGLRRVPLALYLLYLNVNVCGVLAQGSLVT